MSEPIPTPASGFGVRVAAVVCAVACVGVATGFWVVQRKPAGSPTLPTPGSSDKPTPVITAGAPAALKDWGKPDLTIVLTGQTYGYLSPCGCSRPQKGGIERRANFLDGLRAKGWQVVGLDLGDAAAQTWDDTKPKGLRKQNTLKYRTTMQAMAAMGYAAVGLGETEFTGQLFPLLGEYTLQNANKRPIVLGANLVHVGQGGTLTPRETIFAIPNARPMVEDFEVISGDNQPTVAVVGLLGADLIGKLPKIDSQLAVGDAKVTLTAVLAKMDKLPTKPDIRVLMYSGNLDAAKAAAKAFPQFNLIVCQSEESEPPQFPARENDGKTLVVQVGHKGQNVGVVGVFKTDAGYEMKYQLAPLGEEYITPAEKVKGHKVLELLEEYAGTVERDNLLAVARAKPQPHRAQIQLPNDKPTYVGADVCRKCHAAEFAVWNASKHSHAYEALVKAAERPSKRQFDPECVSCHTTGFEYVGGFDNAKASAHLLGNQCENCHGPGSAHAAAPNNKALYGELMSWAAKPGDRLPNIEVFKAAAKLKSHERDQPGGPLAKLTADQKRMMNLVTAMCMKCHDGENDPKFDLIEYFPKIHHSGLKNAGLPPGAK